MLLCKLRCSGRLDFFKILQIITSTVGFKLFSRANVLYLQKSVTQLSASSEITEKLKFLQVTTQ